ncbi:MAG: SEC-C metal-binding domain-containing protein [Phycisphaerae bacterium]
MLEAYTHCTAGFKRFHPEFSELSRLMVCLPDHHSLVRGLMRKLMKPVRKKIGSNSPCPCPCGSGEKYKRCCGF